MVRHLLRLGILVSVTFFGILVAGAFLVILPRLPLPPTHPWYQAFGVQKPEVIGFLPYWLVTKATQNYAQDLTQINYFGLSIGPDGKIIQKLNAQEHEPGWTRLHSQTLADFFASPNTKGLQKSLVVSSGSENDIKALIQDPQRHADNLYQDVAPLMKQYHYTDLNVDIETFRTASPAAQLQFTQFMQRLHDHLQQDQLGTLSVDVMVVALYKNTALDPVQLGWIVDKMIIMEYDYSSRSSSVAGPVAPMEGGSTIRDVDVTQSIQEALKAVPANKIILGIPLYGYGWDTLSQTPGSATVPGTGVTVPSQAAQTQLATCSDCQSGIDPTGQEPYIISQDQATGSAHQVFYEDAVALRHKLQLAETYHLGGVALWALGYEDGELLSPLPAYKAETWWR